MSKHVDSINMNKDAPAFGTEPALAVAKEEPAKAQLETFEDEGVKIYERNPKTGVVQYYDTDGQVVSDRMIDIFMEKYPVAPEYNQQGGEKSGELKLREVGYESHGKEKFEGGKPPEYIVERQDYTEGEAHQATIEKKYYKIVKFLRGELRPPNQNG